MGYPDIKRQRKEQAKDVDLAKHTSCCQNCWFFDARDRRCKRLPDPIRKEREHWCGEWSPNPELTMCDECGHSPEGHAGEKCNNKGCSCDGFVWPLAALSWSIRKERGL